MMGRAAPDAMGCDAGRAQVLDYGCGSGVLAIGALLLGARGAVGVDVDLQALSAAVQNAELNGDCASKLQLFVCEPSSEGPEPVPLHTHGGELFDVVVANILKGPLLDLSDRLLGYVKPGGKLGVSGILVSQAEGIIEHYKASGKVADVQVIDEEGWACIRFDIAEE